MDQFHKDVGSFLKDIGSSLGILDLSILSDDLLAALITQRNERNGGGKIDIPTINV